MSLISEQGFNIKRGKEEAFQKWTTDNDAALKKSSPPGVEYLGTYVVAMSSEKQAGEYRVLWRLDSFATFDAMHEAARREERMGPAEPGSDQVHGHSDRRRVQLLGLSSTDRCRHVGRQLAP